jgi:hypothetical protein
MRGGSTLDCRPSVSEGHSVAITRPTKWAGRPGKPAAGHLFAPRRRMVVFGHSHSGLTHLPDHAPQGRGHAVIRARAGAVTIRPQATSA